MPLLRMSEVREALEEYFRQQEISDQQVLSKTSHAYNRFRAGLASGWRLHLKPQDNEEFRFDEDTVLSEDAIERILNSSVKEAWRFGLIDRGIGEVYWTAIQEAVRRALQPQRDRQGEPDIR